MNLTSSLIKWHEQVKKRLSKQNNTCSGNLPANWYPISKSIFNKKLKYYFGCEDIMPKMYKHNDLITQV